MFFRLLTICIALAGIFFAAVPVNAFASLTAPKLSSHFLAHNGRAIRSRRTLKTCKMRNESPSLVLFAESEGEKNKENNAIADDSFDGKGFASYLAPYALALVASVGVTFLFVKFVLLDY